GGGGQAEAADRRHLPPRRPRRGDEGQVAEPLRGRRRRAPHRGIRLTRGPLPPDSATLSALWRSTRTMKNQPWWIVLACLASIAITSSASALGRADYERLYMVESDVPGLEKKADNKDEGPVPERTTGTFRALGGTFAGRVQ